MDLQTQSTDIKAIHERAGLLYLFSASGVDIYRKSDRQRVGWAALSGVRGGAVNDLGLWLATAAGLWHLPHELGPITARLSLAYSAASATALQSSDVLGVNAAGGALLVITDAGVDYLPAPGAVYRYPVVSLPGASAIGAGKIAYAVAAGCHVMDTPVADWDETAATVLSSAGTPALLSNAVRTLAWGADLFIGTDAGLNIYDPTGETMASITATLGSVIDVRTLCPTPGATAAGGHCAFGTSDGAEGGRFGIIQLG